MKIKKSSKIKMQNKSQKKINWKTTFISLLKRLKPFKAMIIIAITFSIIAALLNILGPKFLNNLMTLLFDKNGYELSTVAKFGLIIVSMYIVAGLLSYLQGYFMSKASVGISKNLRQEISIKINKLPLKYFDKHSYGDILSRVTNDVDTLGNTLERVISTLITSSVTIIGIPIAMFTISWELTLVSLLQIPLALLAAFLVVKFNQKYFVKQQRYLGDINGYIEERFSAHSIIKAFNKEEETQQEFDIINNQLKKSSMRAQFFSGLLGPIVNFTSNIIYVLICLIGSHIAIKTNNMAFLATIITFMTYSKHFNQPISQIGSVFGTLQSTIAAADRVFEFLDEEEQVDESNKTEIINDVQGKVEFRHVDFGYSPDKQIIYDFNFVANPGEKIAIVGPTGAGKTTIVNLLMRFYEVNNGEILIDGKPIQNMNRSYVRSLFAMVLQDTWLFEGTIKENLKFGRPSATDEEVFEACKTANVDHFIRTEPNGYNMVLKEESSISAGQKQLLTIARAMIQNAPLLILDEATSSVDTRTEILIQTAMDRLTKNKTSFVIAHRLSTIKNADKIIVMKDGNIVETGTHNELLEKGGFYKELYISQFDNDEDN